MRIKICGLTRFDQAQAIARLGATAIGFIFVRESPRYLSPEQARQITSHLPQSLDKIGVFVNQDPQIISQIAQQAGLTGVQLHGNETPQTCTQLRDYLPGLEIIKALRIKDSQDLERSQTYADFVNTLLLDAYHPHLWGGTGHTLDWQTLGKFTPPCPWFLAGGLNPDNITQALEQLKPDGVDVSSGVERSPGQKEISKVAALIQAIITIESK